MFLFTKGEDQLMVGHIDVQALCVVRDARISGGCEEFSAPFGDHMGLR